VARGHGVASRAPVYSARIARIAVIGPLARDVVAGSEPRPGGAVLYAARALARLGADAIVEATCAAEDRDCLLPALEALGLPTRWRRSTATASYAFHYEGDRRVMRQSAVADPWTPEHAAAAAGDAPWVHVGALVRSDFPVATLAALADGRRLLVDGQGLVRTPALGPLQLDGAVGGALRHVSILKLDEDEAQILAGGLDQASLHRLGVPEVLVTLGSRGSLVVTDHALERIEAPSAVDAVDPTGAGDIFSAAYLHWRTSGVVPAAAAHRASAFVSTLLAGPARPAP
jgi:sugar/nucleoside kinase (ribokinase family)